MQTTTSSSQRPGGHWRQPLLPARLSSLPAVGITGRQPDATPALLRVWLVIAAVWLVFWTPVAALLSAMLETRPDGIAFFGAVIFAPPLALLTAGAAGILAADAFRTLAAARRRRMSAPSAELAGLRCIAATHPRGNPQAAACAATGLARLLQSLDSKPET